MDLYILNSAYEIIGIIDDAESVLWNKKYNDVGYCEIYTPCSVELISMLQKGNYIFRYDDDMFCKIESIEIKTDAEQGDYIIATATDIAKILAGRIVRWQVAHSGKVADFIRKVLTDNVINPAQPQRAIANFTIDDSNFDELDATIDISAITDDVLQLILTTCKTANYGFRVTYDISAGVLVFRLYRGKNKASTAYDEYTEFSPAFSNIISSSYKEDESNYKNVAYVGYKTATDEFALLSLYRGGSEPSAEDRREIYVDGTGTSRSITVEELTELFGTVTKESRTVVDNESSSGKEIIESTYYAIIKGIRTAVATSTQDVVEAGKEPAVEKITVTDYTFLMLIRILGENTLSERTRSQVFAGAVDWIDTYEYKEDYDLGDIVRVVNEYGIGAAARITEIMESDDNENGYEIEPHFEYLN